ncbi:MAG: hypothetical protein Greene041619_486 [Candidatus Peregrinibacteria bacterium Greene0416_19]|nr:MAG: hypothetical protein Greene041619_486 [Candidatus Peregrinibacteria bacterium Greene0416_19]
MVRGTFEAWDNRLSHAGHGRSALEYMMMIEWVRSIPGIADGNIVHFLSWLTGISGEGTSSFVISRWVFLRALGIIYLIAFVSFWVQAKGLIGSRGILPIQDMMTGLKSGSVSWYQFPTLFWLSGSDTMIHVVCALGVLSSILLVAGVFPTLNLFFLWLLYLSLVTAGQDFMSFQWDILLLETGLLALLLAPSAILPGLARETMVPPLALFLLWFLLFRLMFESGFVKLVSGDSSWLDMTALRYHYETQPLTTWTAWYMHQLPLWFHWLSTVIMYVIELALPFLFFGTPTMRLIAAAGTAALMILIFLTGNYNFFNLLTVALAFLLLNDAAWRKMLPETVLKFIGESGSLAPLSPWFAFPAAVIGTLLFWIAASGFIGTVIPGGSLPLGDRLASVLRPFRSVSDYGLFRVMTRTRPEIIVEGSDDGETWKPYAFRWKAGDVTRRPGFAEPHQPRLDWQMWFAALSDYRSESWFQNFLVRLLQGSPDVLALLRSNPFPDHPPRFVRSRLFVYRFTTAEERRQIGAWWQREERGLYSPVMSLR